MTKILLVEDDKSLREIYGVRLLAEGYDIISAGDGEEALAMAIKDRPDLIVSDVMMPRMNGYELCINIKEDITISHIPIILLTARDDKQSLISGYKNGADAYLTKPFEVEIVSPSGPFI